MSAPTTFTVFGEPVEVLTSTSQNHGRFCAITQTCAPGGGPPPHWHDHEDELFMVISGRFEVLRETVWTELPANATAYVTRGTVHTFRNCGETTGTILCIAAPGNLDDYLRAISPIQMPQDAPQLFQISDTYGIHFPPFPQPNA